MSNSKRWTAGTLFVLLASSAIAATQETPAGSVAVRDGFGVGVLDGRVVGGGRDYRTEVSPAGIAFTPAFGANATRTYPWTYTLDWIGRSDGTTLWSASATGAAPDVDGATVDLARGGNVEERYEHRKDGVEQSFTFATMPVGSGDLVVRGHFATDLRTPASGHYDAGVTFDAPGLGAVTLSRVLGIDARGATSNGSMRIDGNTIEYTLPAGFVDGAAYPMVLDPLIGTATTVASGYDEEDPDSAFEASLNKWCVVWRRVFASNDADVRAQFVDTNGVLSGGLIFVESDANMNITIPRVADMNLTNHFLVTWVDITGFLTGSIKCRTIDGTTGAVSVKANVGPLTGLNTAPDVSGEFLKNFDRGMIVWSQFDTVASEWRVLAAQVQVPASGVPSVFPEFVVASGYSDTQPSISQTGGQFGNHMVAWKRTFTTGQIDIRAAVINRNGTIVQSLVTVTNDADEENAPNVDGDGVEFAVAYENTPVVGASKDILIQRVGPVQTGVGTSTWKAIGNVFALGFISPDDLVQPTLAWLFGTVVGAYRQEVGTHHEGRMFSYDPFALQSFETTAQNPIQQVGVHDESVRIASGTIDYALATIERENVASTGNLVAYRHLAIDGAHLDLSGGSAGRSYAMGAKVGNPNFRLQLVGARPNSATYVILSGAVISVPCGISLLVADPNLGLFLNAGATDANGELAIATGIPNVPAYVGLSFVMQWLTVNPINPGCPSLGVDLSNGLKVTLQ